MCRNGDIFNQLRQEIATRTRVEAGDIDPDAHFLFDLGMSSLDLLAMLAFAEKSFSTRFPDECLSELTTLNKMNDAIQGYQQATRRKSR